MRQEEIRIRCLYLFLASSRAVEEFKTQLTATFPAQPMTSQLQLNRVLRKELGLLFRYWSTRRIWDLLDRQEDDAKAMNLALLRLFTDGFRLPKDGSGLRYAELSTPAEEARELTQRIASALEMAHQPMADVLHSRILHWRDTVNRQTADALELSIDQLTIKVKAWAGEV